MSSLRKKWTWHAVKSICFPAWKSIGFHIECVSKRLYFTGGWTIASALGSASTVFQSGMNCPPPLFLLQVLIKNIINWVHIIRLCLIFTYWFVFEFCQDDLPAALCRNAVWRRNPQLTVQEGMDLGHQSTVCLLNHFFITLLEIPEERTLVEPLNRLVQQPGDMQVGGRGILFSQWYMYLLN